MTWIRMLHSVSRMSLKGLFVKDFVPSFILLDGMEVSRSWASWDGFSSQGACPQRGPQGLSHFLFISFSSWPWDNQFCPLHAPVMMYFFTQSNRVDQSQTKSTKTESKQTVSLCKLGFFSDIKVTESWHFSSFKNKPDPLHYHYFKKYMAKGW